MNDRNPMSRLLIAWLDTPLSLGRFLENACQLHGTTIGRMSETELADAAEKYVISRKERNRTELKDRSDD